MSEARWFLYILHCGDGTYYTGITTDVERRFALHRAGRGAKYTKGRGPLVLVFSRECRDHSAALRAENTVKKLSRAQKMQLILSPEISWKTIVDRKPCD